MTLTLDWSRGPHIRKQSSVRLAMLEHAIALAPGVAATAVYHGAVQLLLVAATVIAALATQELLNRLLKRQRSLPDGRAAVSGLMLALLLPLNTVWWAGLLAGALGMLAAGLLEYSKLKLKVNPVVPGVLAATAFAAWMPDLLFSGGQPGPLSVDTMPLLLALGGLYLIMRRHINWRTPLVVMVGGGVLATSLGFDAVNLISSGTWILGAFFLAADWRTSPITPRGKIVSAVIIGVVAALLDSYVLFSGGMIFAILVGNLLAAPINRYTRLRAFGLSPGATQ